ncbi:MAG: sensor histidine kinase [Shewanella sp.]
MPSRLFYRLALLLIIELSAALLWIGLAWPIDGLVVILLLLVSIQYLCMRSSTKKGATNTNQLMPDKSHSLAIQQPPLPQPSLISIIDKAVHEINTPLGTSLITVTHCQDALEHLEKIITTNEHNLNEITDYISENKQSLALMHNNLLRLNDLIKNFHTVSHNHDTLHAERIHIASHIEQIVSDMRPQIGMHSINVDCDQQVWFSLSPTILYNIINNLLLNASRHAFDDGTLGNILLAVSIDEEQQLTILCQDNGLGMTDEIKSQIFTPFFTTKQGLGGSGLGLAIVHGALMSIHGTISCESQPYQGSKFIIKIPSLETHARDFTLVRQQVS